jgi:hypothetical protein
VEIVSGEVVRTVEATREVILAAGTIEDITCDNGMPAFLAYPAGEGFPIVAGDSARAPQGTGVVTVVTGPVEPPPG